MGTSKAPLLDRLLDLVNDQRAGSVVHKPLGNIQSVQNRDSAIHEDGHLRGKPLKDNLLKDFPGHRQPEQKFLKGHLPLIGPDIIFKSTTANIKPPKIQKKLFRTNLNIINSWVVIQGSSAFMEVKISSNLGPTKSAKNAIAPVATTNKIAG